MSIRIAVLASGSGTNLQALIDAAGRGELPHGELALVASNKADAFALRRAAAAGIAAVAITQGDFEAALSRELESRGIGLIILAGFLKILSPGFTKSWAGRIINVHPSLLPSFGGDGFYGLRVHRAALERGVKVSGATVHYVDETVDGGKIIAQRAVEVLPGDTPESLQRRIMEQAEWIILPQAARLVAKKLSEGEQEK